MRLPLLLAALATLGIAACDADSGTDTIIEVPPKPRVTLNVDSVTMDGPSCVAEVSMTEREPELRQAWTVENPEILAPVTLNTRTGTTSGLYQGFIARAPGEGRVIATQSNGTADTVFVRVLRRMPTLSIPPDTIRLAVGDSTVLPATLGNLCPASPPVYVYLAEMAQKYSSADVYTRSLAPDVFTVTLGGFRMGGLLRGVKPGTGLAVMTAWGATDTAVVRVFQR